MQACADAASERVQALEAQLDAQSAEAETATAAAEAELEAAHAGAAATLITVRAELKASLVAAETELASTKVPCFLRKEKKENSMSFDACNGSLYTCFCMCKSEKPKKVETKSETIAWWTWPLASE